MENQFGNRKLYIGIGKTFNKHFDLFKIYQSEPNPLIFQKHLKILHLIRGNRKSVKQML